MTFRVRRAGATAAIFVAALIALGIDHLLAERFFPPVIARSDNARALLEPSLAAHLEHAFRARLPTQATSRAHLVALTFDDGPYPVDTPLLLDQLARLRVPATFFLIGDDARLFPALVRRIAAGGNEIANHTETHPANFDRLSPTAVARELNEAAATLRRYATDPAIATLMRPPHGRFTLGTVTAAQRAGYDVVLWTDDAGDWRARATAPVIVAHVERYATAPDIILMHSGKLHTIEALPELVARFRAAGFRFVTVGELLRDLPSGQILHPARVRM